MTPFAGFLCFGSVTLLCFVIAIATWSRVALSKNPSVPPHVAYLRRPYKTGCAMMEVERLSFACFFGIFLLYFFSVYVQTVRRFNGCASPPPETVKTQDTR